MHMYPREFVYDGIEILQPPTVMDAMTILCAMLAPERIVEIGTARGGLTRLLRTLCPDARIVTYDYNEKPAGLPPSVAFFRCDVFDFQEHVAFRMAGPGPTLLLCDGGDKIREFVTFAKYLKAGDVIMAHDYEAPGWSWIEITDADVAETVEQYRLVRYGQDVVGPAAWLSYQRAA